MPDLFLYILAGILGGCVGSFLNVLALRTLAERSIFYPPSACPGCEKAISAQDMVPVISYFALKGKCRHCGQRIHWHYPLVEFVTGVFFVVVVYAFHPGGPQSAGLDANHAWLTTAAMLFFASTLITVTITDFKEKLIPHEITYPAILLGITYSAFLRKDFFGTLAGIGCCYIFFDFLAFYGLKLYVKMHGVPGDNVDKDDEECEEKGEGAADFGEADDEIDESFAIAPPEEKEPEMAEDFEVMGGGDAVLAALIAAWLGWQRLGFALFVGFIVGTLMGVAYLMKEMHRQKMLKQCIAPGIIGFVLGFGAITGFSVLVAFSAHNPDQTPMQALTTFTWVPFAAIIGVSGALLGIVATGSRLSKPFPFGPALAAGAAAAMFSDPVGNMMRGGA